jgi:hypothetical protein
MAQELIGYGQRKRKWNVKIRIPLDAICEFAAFCPIINDPRRMGPLMMLLILVSTLRVRDFQV